MKTPEKAFYINPKNIQNKIFSLCEKESYHAAKVLRLKLGDTIVLVDGKSQGYFGLIEKIKPDTNKPIILFELLDSITGLSILLVNITPKIINTNMPPT